MQLKATLSVILTFTTQAVLSFSSSLPSPALNFFNVSYSTPEQCGSFNVSYTGSSAPNFPLSLTIAPFSANPLTLNVSDNSWVPSTNSGSIHISFLPFLGGTEFVASLDDVTGNSIGLVSDVIAVKNSGTTSCLLPQGNTNFYNVMGEFDQCSHFNVTFSPDKIDVAPKIRAFLPRSFSFPINATDEPIKNITIGGGDDGGDSHNSKNSSPSSSTTSPSSATSTSTSTTSTSTSRDSHPHKLSAKNITFQEYVLDVFHGFQVVLLLDDGQGHRETSKLYTVGGDASSSHGCFQESIFQIPPSQSSTPESDGDSGEKFSRAGVIAISVLSAAVTLALCAILVIYFMYFRKRPSAKVMSGSFNFTEDIDMGSSFASRVRYRLSQLTGGLISYRGDRSDKRTRSSWVPTSPTGSICHRNSMSCKRASWIEFEKRTADNYRSPSLPTNDDHCQDDLGRAELGALTIPSAAFIPVTPTEKPTPAPSPFPPGKDCSNRSSADSQFLLGSGYLSSTTSRRSMMRMLEREKPTKHLVPPAMFRLSRKSSSTKKDSCTSCASVPSSVSSGYAPSKSSFTSTLPLPDFGASGIYISSPIRPSHDLPRSVTPSLSEASRNRPRSGQLPPSGGTFPASRWSIRRPL